MGCPSEIVIEKNLVFSILTYNPSTGILADADSAPAYRIYEDETATAILTGTMAKLDDANTLGLYSELIACTAVNGFEEYKTYTIYITAVVSGNTIGFVFSFRVRTHVWDEILTGATHNIPTSAGRKLRELASPIIVTGISPGTGNTSTRIKLDSLASSINGAYDPAIIIISGGTGEGQCRQIFEYDGTNKFAYINRDWKVVPDATSEYTILANSGDTHINEGKAQAGAASSLTLNALASNINDTYKDQVLFIFAGAGQDQARKIISYNGTTKVATVDRPWDIVVDETSIYGVLPNYNVPTGLKKGVAISNFDFLMVSNVDHETPAVGLTITGEYSKSGDSGFTALSGTITEKGHGLYSISTISAAEAAGNSIALRFSAAGADDRIIIIYLES
jgi:hypothetical protein